MRRIMGIGTLVLLLIPSVAAATLITGAFDGTVTSFLSAPQPNGPPVETILERPISGTFEFETDPALIPQPAPREPEVGSDGASYFGSLMRMTYAIGDSIWIFDNSIEAYGGPRLDFATTAQRDLLALAVGGPYWYSQMHFEGASRALFAAPDILTFDPLGIDLARSSATFSGSIRSEQHEVRFTRLMFDGYGPVGVPTPGTLALFALGLVLLAGMQRTRWNVRQFRCPIRTARRD